MHGVVSFAKAVESGGVGLKAAGRIIQLFKLIKAGICLLATDACIHFTSPMTSFYLLTVQAAWSMACVYDHSR